MNKNMNELTKLDPSEALGTDALLQVEELIALSQYQKEAKTDECGRAMEKPIMDAYRHKREINPDSSVLKKELREKAKIRSQTQPKEGEKKDSWGQELQKELEEKVREFRNFNQKMKEN